MMMTNLKLAVRPWLAAMALVAAPAWAHHSAVGYDLTRTVSANATLKEFLWIAPHSSAVFTIVTADGKAQEITLGSAAPNKFAGQGFKPRDFKAGQKVEITWYPTRNGKPGGLLATMKLPDGRVFEDIEFANLSKINAKHFEDDSK